MSDTFFERSPRARTCQPPNTSRGEAKIHDAPDIDRIDNGFVDACLFRCSATRHYGETRDAERREASRSARSEMDSRIRGSKTRQGARSIAFRALRMSVIRGFATVN